MSTMEAGLRGAAIALSVLLAVLLLRDGRAIPAARYAALLALGGAAIQVTLAAPLVVDQSLWLLPLRILAFGNAPVFALVAFALFDDQFTLSWPHIGLWAGVTGLGLWAVYGTGHYAFPLFNGAAILCVLSALAHVLAGRAGDLIEERRRLRLVFVMTVALFTAAISLTAILLHGGRDYPAFGYADAAGSLAIVFCFAVLLLSLTPGALFQAMAQPTPPPLPAPERAAAPPPVESTPEDDPREKELLAALRRELDENRAYREENLGITALAGRLGVPEYRLRRLINQRLGHRNFAALLNGCRLDEVMAALDDEAQDGVPILTIALDAGFQSAGAFNRAFKARTGLTPTEYRRQRSTFGETAAAEE